VTREAPREGKPSWSGASRTAGVAIVSLAIGSAFGYAVGHRKVRETNVTPPRPSLTDNERALLAPVTEGGRLGDFDVTEVHAIDDGGGLRLACRKEHAVVRLEITLAAPGGPAPPISVGPYAIYYSLQDASPVDGEALATSLGAILHANSAVPIPPKLAPFNALHPPPTPLPLP
jgi:hypothetical protein